MTCYRIEIPPEAVVTGVNAQGRPARVLPGQYLVHELQKLSLGKPLLRFVGADAGGRDVHVRPEAVARFIARSASDAHALAEGA